MATVVLLLIVTLVVPSGDAIADEDDLKDLREEREALAEQRAAQAASVDAAAAEFEEVTEALEILNNDVESAEGRLAASQQAVEDSKLALESIEQQESYVQEQMDQTAEGLQDLAVQWYVAGRDTEQQSSYVSLDAATPTEAAVKETLFKVRLGQETNLVDRMRELADDLDLLVENRARAVEEAAEREEVMASRLDDVEASRDRLEEFAMGVEERLDQRLAEAASLEALDAELAQQIRNEEREIARKLAEARRREELARRAAAVPNIVGDGEIVNVGGIRVHSSISNNLAQLLQAAAADGVLLGGGGYRNSSAQIALRRAHCGSSDYEVYQKPSYQCRPPTARPGYSNHERGLAVDFTAGGRAITSRSTAAFKWLAANAAKYGFYNLPSEPWHWSVNGQ
ncbi:MAG: hypothetical protein GY708_20095 [Actinomycetia bacterium]|nr:hypothetical protein [Actinomycetes bacterium]MCP4959615.1 hypothetical protein [Actinomycetes bacterium]